MITTVPSAWAIRPVEDWTSDTSNDAELTQVKDRGPQSEVMREDYSCACGASFAFSKVI